MSRLSSVLKRLKRKPKQKNDEITLSATKVATSQPLQRDTKPLPGPLEKTFLPQILAQGSHEPDSASKITPVGIQKPLPCEPILQPLKAAALSRKLSGMVPTVAEAAIQPDPKSPSIKSPKETQQFKVQQDLPEAETFENQFRVLEVPKAPKSIAQQPSHSEKAPASRPQMPRASKPIVTTTKGEAQRTPKATLQVPESTSTPASTLKPAVQTHAGLYSNFTPSIGAVDHPHPKTFAEAQKAALDVLNGATLSGYSATRTGQQYSTQDRYNYEQNNASAETSGSSTMSNGHSYLADSPYISYTPSSPHVPSRPSEKFRPVDPLDSWAEYLVSGQNLSAGEAMGGGTIAHTGGRFGEGSVFKTGGSFGEGSVLKTGGRFGEGSVFKTSGSLGEGSVFKTGGSLGEALGVQTEWEEHWSNEEH